MHACDNHFWALIPPEADSARLICLSETGVELKALLKSKKTYPISAELWRAFFKTNRKLYIGMPYDNTVYLVKNDSICSAFHVDAGRYAIPQDFYNDPFETFSRLLQKGYASVYNFLESRDFIVLQISIIQEDFEGVLWGIKNKQAKKWFWSQMQTWPTNQQISEFTASYITDDNRLMILVYPHDLKEHLPFMKKTLNVEIVSTVNEHDNPILMEIRLNSRL